MALEFRKRGLPLCRFNDAGVIPCSICKVSVQLNMKRVTVVHNMLSVVNGSWPACGFMLHFAAATSNLILACFRTSVIVCTFRAAGSSRNAMGTVALREVQVQGGQASERNPQPSSRDPAAAS